MTNNLNRDFWRDRRVFVTGATGLVGGWLVKRLVEAEADVICLVRDWIPRAELNQSGLLDKVSVVRGDLCDLDCLERTLGEFEIETVIHLAAQAIVGIANRNPLSTFEANIGGTWKLLEACRRSPKVKQIVSASSDKAYGDSPVLPYTEETPLAGRHPYDVSKSCSDLICQTYATTYRSPVVITRCGNFYGGGDLNWNRIVPGTIRSVLRGQRPVIRSDGSFIRDYFYVEDGAAAYMHLAEQLAARPELAGEAFNLSNETQVTVLQLVEKVLAGMNGGEITVRGSRTRESSDRSLTTSATTLLTPEVLGEASHEIKHQSLDATKARTLLGWEPLFTLDEGLSRTIAWYKNYFQSLSEPRLRVVPAAKAA